MWVSPIQVHLGTDFFPVVNTTVLHDPCLVEAEDAEPQIRRKHVYGGILNMEGQL